MSDTLDLFSAEDGDSADLSGSAGQALGVADSAGTSHGQAGAVRSWPDAVDTATGSDKSSAGPRGKSSDDTKGLSAMLLPELATVAGLKQLNDFVNSASRVENNPDEVPE